MLTCADHLWRLGYAPGAVEDCACGCDRMWQARDLTWWGRLAFWRTTVPGPFGVVWVRLSARHRRNEAVCSE